MLETAITFQSKKFKLSEKGNDSFIPGHDLATYLLKKLLDNGLHLVHGLKNKNFDEAIDETCYHHFELKDDTDVLEFYINLLILGTPAKEYWSVQFNKHLSFFKAISKPKLMYCFSPKIIIMLESAIREIGDIENLQRLTDKQYSALLIG